MNKAFISSILLACILASMVLPGLARATQPLIVVYSGNVVEGTGGLTIMPFRVVLTSASNVPVSFHYRTEDSTAMAPDDYQAEDTTFTIPAGETDVQLPIYVVPDSIAESTETFLLHLSDAVNATLTQNLLAGVIIDDDTPVDPELSIGDVAQKRGLSGSREMAFPLTLNGAQPVPVSVRASTMDLTAIAGVDYVARSQLITFQPGQTSKNFIVTIFGWPVPIADKVFFVNLTDSTVELNRPAAGGIIRYGQTPIVALTSPPDQTLFVAPAHITITADASDPDGTIDRVEFYRDGVQLSEDDSPPYICDWTNPPPGVYELSARAINTLEQSASSEPHEVSVAPAGYDQIFASGFE